MLLVHTVIWKKTESQLSSSKGTTWMSRSQEKHGKSSLQMVSNAGLQREAKLSNITPALEHLTGFLCLALQTPFLIAFLFLLSYAGSYVPNSIVGILLPETGTVESSVAMLTIAAANCIFNMVLEASPGCLESTLCTAKWRHCLTFRCPNNLQDLAASNWRLLGQLNLPFCLILLNIIKYEAAPKNEKYWQMNGVFCASLICYV